MDFLHSFVRWSRHPQGMITLGVCAFLLACSAWVLFGRTPGGASRKKADYRYMHCPKCGMETMYNPELASGACLQCKQARYVATVTRVSEAGAGPASLSSRLLVFGFIVLIILQAITYFWISFHRKGPAPEEVELMKCRCPSCKRKFAYTVNKAGVKARCPRCKSEFVLPETSED